uniref:FlgD/Vpr Ig-like domain-containing protein n=1 Tax=Eiseniibacteriota bacterium TaxID=2212470 RepID=A0A832MM62_UNCEI
MPGRLARRHAAAWPAALLCAALCGAVFALLPPLVPAALAQEGDDEQARLEALARMKRDAVWEGARARAAAAAALRGAAGRAAARPGARRLTPGAPEPRPSLGAPFGAPRTSAVTPEVLVNDNTSDLFLGITNSEVALGAVGPFVLAAWNDGAGNDRQGWALSTDGGGTFVDGGAVPPLPAGWQWRSDPVVCASPSVGRIMYAALAESTAARNGLWLGGYYPGIGGWEPWTLVRAENTAQFIVDKPWLACDPTTDTFHLVYTLFDIAGATNHIVEQTVVGLPLGSAIGPAVTLSSPADAGRVQGARVVMRPGGERAATWAVLGTGFDDHLRYRETAAGLWQPEVTVADFYSHFGTGAPGFNRPVSVYFPSLAVNEAAGPAHGRRWIAWSESFNHLDDILSFPPVATGPTVAEIEPNGTNAQATSFVPGDILRGVTSAVSPADVDYFAATLNSGDHLLLWCDSLPPAQTYRLEVEGPAGLKLAFGGDTRTGPTVQHAYFFVTAPAPGAYFVRFRPAFGAGSSFTGGYRVRTWLASPSPGDRATDRRDAFAALSDDGVNWAVTGRVADSPLGSDDWLPEVAVAADGYPHATWYDFRTDAYLARSRVRVARAGTPAAWDPSVELASVDSDWSAAQSNLAPNQGDYNALVRDADLLRAGWADARHGTPDVFATAWGTRWDMLCPPDASAPAGATVTTDLHFPNLNPVSGYDMRLTVADLNGYFAPTVTHIPIPPLGLHVESVTHTMPFVPPGTVIDMVATAEPEGGGSPDTCRWRFTVTAPTAASGAPPALSLAPPAPNPARGDVAIGYALPRDGRVRLALYGANGALVRVLEDDARAAGAHVARWDGRDGSGRRVAPGLYFARLEIEGGERLERKVVRVD